MKYLIKFYCVLISLRALQSWLLTSMDILNKVVISIIYVEKPNTRHTRRRMLRVLLYTLKVWAALLPEHATWSVLSLCPGAEKALLKGCNIMLMFDKNVSGDIHPALSKRGMLYEAVISVCKLNLILEYNDALFSTFTINFLDHSPQLS